MASIDRCSHLPLPPPPAEALIQRFTSVVKHRLAWLPLAGLVAMGGITFAQGAGSTAQVPQASQPPGVAQTPTIVVPRVTTVADPKLERGGFPFVLGIEPATAASDVRVEVLQNDTVIKTVWSGPLLGTAPPRLIGWDGQDEQGDWADVGSYTLRVTTDATGDWARPWSTEIHIVRLGIRSIEFMDGEGDNEFQMVYFMRGTQREFTATPAFHEYLNEKNFTEASDLDLDNGDPRPMVPVHTGTAEPAMEGSVVAGLRYNYPIAVVRGTVPRMKATLGVGGTTVGGAPQGCGFPIAGFDVRMTAELGGTRIGESAPLVPGTAVEFNLPRTRMNVSRWDVPIRWSWEYSEQGSGVWRSVPGSSTTTHRIYTLFGPPQFKAGATGTQYVGPWVEVADYWYEWSTKVGADMSTDVGVIENHVKGFFGQNSGIPTAIEGVLYDSPGQGGGGGATRYFSSSWDDMRLGALLNEHQRGVYVNCTDNMGATTTMLAMMGFEGIRPVRLGSMSLKAIWGIGASGYTTDLWQSGNHGFSYHHIVTRDDRVTVIDTCMQLDEDGTPQSAPGLPGWNVDRIWAGPGGYNNLSSYNSVNTNLESLPGVR